MRWPIACAGCTTIWAVANASSTRELYLRLLSHVRPHARMFALAVAGMVAAAATEPLFPALIKPLLDGGFGARQTLPPIVFALAIVGIFIVRGVLSFSASYCLNWVATRVVLDLRAAMFSRLVRLPAKFFDDHPSGALLSKVAYDVAGVTGAATTVLTVAVKDSITIVGLLGWLLYLNWQLTLLALVIAPPIAVVMRVIGRRLRRISRSAQHAMGDLVHVLQESIEAHKVVKVFGGQDYEARRFARTAQAMRGYSIRQGVASAMITPITHSLAALALAVIVYLALHDSMASRATVGDFASFITAMMMLLAPIKHLTEMSGTLQRGLAAAESVFELVDAPIEDDAGGVTLGRARGDLRFDNVSFSYPLRDAPALSGIDLHVRPGETVALIGASGAGKTTLANLVPRFYSPCAGRILLDGHDLQSLSLASLRANIALVSQEVVLFNDSIAANIAYGGMAGASEQEVLAAATAANAIGFIRELPEGLATLIGENGLRLSGGQRQRLAIARAILKNAPLLILDEATSALDSESERQVQVALEALLQGRTTLVIAHRLSTIERADRIIVLERGRIVETGRHQDLLAVGGTYARLHRSQYAAGAAA